MPTSTIIPSLWPRIILSVVFGKEIAFCIRTASRYRESLHENQSHDLDGPPGIVIGRKGQELDSLRDSLNQVTGKGVRLEIQEIKKPDLVASLVAESVALQLERRIAFRRAMKKAVQTTMSMGAEGIRIQCAGRLAGADIARTEQLREGRVPLHTLRENIDYGLVEANTVYGIIGIKCWICLKDEDKIF